MDDTSIHSRNLYDEWQAFGPGTYTVSTGIGEPEVFKAQYLSELLSEQQRLAMELVSEHGCAGISIEASEVEVVLFPVDGTPRIEVVADRFKAFQDLMGCGEIDEPAHLVQKTANPDVELHVLLAADQDDPELLPNRAYYQDPDSNEIRWPEGDERRHDDLDHIRGNFLVACYNTRSESFQKIGDAELNQVNHLFPVAFSSYRDRQGVITSTPHFDPYGCIAYRAEDRAATEAHVSAKGLRR